MGNLLSNAVKFTPEGGTIQITAAATPEGVSIAVRDTGIGIPVSDLPQVFEPFFQVDSGLTRLQRGSGLGLPIVKTLVEAMGGTITVSSQPDKGSTFRVTMPLADEQYDPVS
ncbi:Sensor histidine kinase RcsC [compost metagenome]